MARSSKSLAPVLLLILRLSCLSLAQTAEELDQKAREAYAAHDYKTAAEFARRVYDAKSKTSPPDSFELATAALNLGKSLVLADQSKEGAIFIGKACEIARKRFGTADKRLGSCLMELTDAQLKAEQYAEAKATADDALVVKASISLGWIRCCCLSFGRTVSYCASAHPFRNIFRASSPPLWTNGSE